MGMIKKIVNYFSEVKQPKTYVYCRRCGRKLSSEDSKALGIGISCYKKEIQEKYKNKLF